MQEVLIIQYLINHDINPKHKGFNYIISAAQYNLRAGSHANELYNYVAQQYCTTASNVERCIRNAIERSWAAKEEQKPTNSQLITRVCVYIRSKMPPENGEKNNNENSSNSKKSNGDDPFSECS